MPCKIHYLDSTGVHPTESGSLDALSQAFPSHWVLYASFRCLLRRAPSIQVDALVAMEDRVLLLELRCLRDEPSANGDRWIFPNGIQKTSPVYEAAAKAVQLKGLLQEVVQGWSGAILVDAMVVLTGQARGAALPAEQREKVISLEQACSLADPAARKNLLMPSRLQLLKPCDLKAELDKAFRNPRFFKAREKLWNGYRVVREDHVFHPGRIWTEHLGEKAADERQKALIRVWRLDRLPATFNTAEARKRTVTREPEALALLSHLGSRLAVDGVLQVEGASPEDILTDHAELRRVAPGTADLYRFLTSSGQDTGAEDRRAMSALLLAVLRDLHAAEIAHRDLGLRNVWTAGPSSVAVTGLHVCWMTGDEMHDGAFEAIRFHRGRPPMPAGAAAAKAADAAATAAIVADILRGAPSKPGLATIDLAGSGSEFLQPWLARAQEPAGGFADGAEALAAFGEMLDQAPAEDAETNRLEAYVVPENPYASWAVVDSPVGQAPSRHAFSGRRHADGTEGDVTVWPGWLPGASTSSDLALLKLMDGAARASRSGRADFPVVLEHGIGYGGAFLATASVPRAAWDLGAASNPAEAARHALAMLEAVDAMHRIGVDHGDLRPSSFSVAEPDGRLVLLDMFGPSRPGPAVAQGQAQAGNRPAEAPRAADRRAAIALAATHLRAAAGTEAEAACGQLEEELGRETVETLAPALAWLTALERRLSAPPRRQLRVHVDGGDESLLAGEGSRLLCRAFLEGPGWLVYVLTGVERELTLRFPGEGSMHSSLAATRFPSLEAASRSGTELPLDVVLTSGAGAGPAEVREALSAVPHVRRGPAASEAALTGQPFDIRSFWQASLDIEEQRLPTVVLTNGGDDADGSASYEYSLAGREIDFDPDDEVEAAPEGDRPIAEMLVRQLGPSTLALRYYGARRFVVGDRVVLHERRRRESLQRRRRAVGKMLTGEAAIADLLEYFDPRAVVEAQDYGRGPSDEELAVYKLNEGQREAFRHVVRFGPVGLQQGPPGTGKTRFIAALVHWLVTRGGAERVLIASQGNEAVNNAVEALVKLHRTLNERRPNILRIGTKNITPKVRPFETSALRERYRVRFDAAARSRVVSLAAALGIDRGFAGAAFDLEAGLGAKVRLLGVLAATGAEGQDTSSADDRRRDARRLSQARAEAEAALAKSVGPGCEGLGPEAAMDLAFERLALVHGDLPPGDVASMRSVLGLARQWADSLGVSSRNFEEFLAKTRPVLAATCVGAGQTKIRIDARPFDWVIVDEAARCTSTELAVPVHLGRRVLLVGDHLQLKPMLDRDFLKELGQETGAPDEELSKSDFERAFDAPYGRTNGRAFHEQYRMVDPICRLVSKVFYEPSGIRLFTSDQRESDGSFDSLSAPLDAPVTWVDTSGAAGNRELRPGRESSSFYNDAEVDAAMALLRRISREDAIVRAMEQGDEDNPVGVICMYQGQVERMRAALAEQAWHSPRFARHVRVETVDSYQGKENSIVVLSLVRSNPRKLQGHVATDNRCNVALSRAKERLFILGDKEMWSRCRPTDPMRRVWSHVSSGPPGTQVLTVAAFA